MTKRYYTCTCHLCGTPVQRERERNNAVCFTCKVNRQKERLSYNSGKIKIRNLTSYKSQVLPEEKNLSPKKAYGKPCSTCGQEMYNVSFNKVYCSGECQRLKYRKLSTV